ncbi:hypothetical protein [uncultured Endozoicomonas sp.]|uniref:hypothetical protein n=1 Tax=uncultured Endozoicomonas sp. TaxID=432652 RepID=UPI00263A2AAD|nr:hypothetical protein [uncultured Endozoicomonas sp.]
MPTYAGDIQTNALPKVRSQSAARQRQPLQVGQLAQTHTLDSPIEKLIQNGSAIFSNVADQIETTHYANKQEAINNDQLLVKRSMPLYNQAFKERTAKFSDEQKLDTEAYKLATEELSAEYFKGVSQYSKDKVKASLEADSQLLVQQNIFNKDNSERLQRGSLALDGSTDSLESLQQTISLLKSSDTQWSDSMNEEEINTQLYKMYQANPRNLSVNDYIINSETFPAHLKESVRESERSIKSFDTHQALSDLAKAGKPEAIASLAEVAQREGKLTAVQVKRYEEEGIKNYEFKQSVAAAKAELTTTGKAPVKTKLTKEQLAEATNEAYQNGNDNQKRRLIAQSVVPMVKDQIAQGLIAKDADGYPDRVALYGAYTRFSKIAESRGGIGFAQDYAGSTENFNQLLLMGTLIKSQGQMQGINQYVALKGKGLPAIKYSPEVSEGLTLTGNLSDNPAVMAEGKALLNTYSQLGLPEDQAKAVTQGLLKNNFIELEVEEGSWLGFFNSNYKSKDLVVRKDIKPVLDELEANTIGDETVGDILGSYLKGLTAEIEVIQDNFDIDDYQIYADPRNSHGLVIFAEGNPLIRVEAEDILNGVYP